MAVQWYIQIGGQQRGPISSTELKRYAEQGLINRDTRLKQAGTDRWALARRVKGLFPVDAAEDPVLHHMGFMSQA